MALENAVLLGSKEETEAKPRCFASITQCLFQKPLLGAARLYLLQIDSIFGQCGEVPAKDVSSCQFQCSMLKMWVFITNKIVGNQRSTPTNFVSSSSPQMFSSTTSLSKDKIQLSRCGFLKEA